AGHIPGAAYAHLDRDLSGPKTGTNGRHPLPEAAVAARTFGRLGITSGKQVVAYDQDNGMFASRLWWLLRWLGHDAVAVLDGGFAKWIAERHRVASGEEMGSPRTFMAEPRGEMVAGADEVAARAGGPRSRLVRVSTPARGANGRATRHGRSNDKNLRLTITGTCRSNVSRPKRTRRTPKDDQPGANGQFVTNNIRVAARKRRDDAHLDCGRES